MTKEQAEHLVAFEGKFSKADLLFSISPELTLTPYNYGDEITDFIQFCYDNDLVKADYSSIEQELIANRTKAAWYGELSEEKVILCLSYFIRSDRFCDGLLASAINDGTVPLLIGKIKVLHAL